jgi:hypothetical protein
MRPIFVIGALITLLLVSLACSPAGMLEAALGTEEATDTSVPTETAEAVEASPTPALLIKPTPTGPQATSPAPDSLDSPTGQLPLSESIYVHLTGGFVFYPPAGWILDEGDPYATWSAPDDSGWIDVYIHTTGYTLDEASVQNFITANENNWFATFTRYAVLDRYVDDYGADVVDQTLDLSGVLMFVRSIYYQADDVIFEVDFWQEERLAGAYSPTYQQIWDDMQLDPVAASSVVPYTAFTWTFTDDEGLFTFDVPYAWLYERYTDESVVVDTFTAPDGAAFVESLKYDEGIEVSKSESGAIALELLREFYASDLKVTDDQVQPDGSERLIWESPGGDYSGVTFFETRGTTFLFLNFVSEDDLYDLYLDTFNRLVETYSVP